MSRRTRRFRLLRGKDATATALAILARNGKRAVSTGRMKPGRATGLIGTLPMDGDKAKRIAGAIHRATP